VLARVQLTLAAGLLLVAVALGGVLLLGPDGKVTSTSGAGAGSVGPNGFVGAVAPDGVQPTFALSDQNGKRVSLADYRGKVVVVTFMYSTCQDTCPTTAQQIRLALDDLGSEAEQVPALAVSVDPPPQGGDTALNAKRFLNKQSLTGRMRFLLGSQAQLKPVWKAYGIQPQGQGTRPQAVDPRAFEHSAKVFLVDRQGRLRVGFPVSELSPEGLAHDLKRLLAAA
jgi:protein SCO1/2